MVRAALLCWCVVLLLSLSLDAQAGVIIFEQLPRTDVGVAEVSSARDTRFDEAGGQVWDNFTLSSSWTITQIDWWGFNQYPDTSTPGFSFGFYTDVRIDNASDAVPLHQTVGEVSIIGSFSILDAQDVPIGLVYNYSTTLTNPFAADAGTYWLSIYNESDAPTWGWQIAPDPTFNGAIQTDYEYGWTDPVNNVAFRIVGTSVPEPSLVLLLGLGIGSACLIGWRFRN